MLERLGCGCGYGIVQEYLIDVVTPQVELVSEETDGEAAGVDGPT
jgi:hypothetical protein